MPGEGAQQGSGWNRIGRGRREGFLVTCCCVVSHFTPTVTLHGDMEGRGPDRPCWLKAECSWEDLGSTCCLETAGPRAFCRPRSCLLLATTYGPGLSPSSPFAGLLWGAMLAWFGLLFPDPFRTQAQGGQQPHCASESCLSWCLLLQALAVRTTPWAWSKLSAWSPKSLLWPPDPPPLHLPGEALVVVRARLGLVMGDQLL